MGALAAAGLLIERRNKAGSFVAPPPVPCRRAGNPRSAGGGRGPQAKPTPGRASAGATRRFNPADPDEAALGAPGEKALALEGLHFAHGAPFALERRVIALAAVPGAASVDFGEAVAPGSWLLRQGSVDRRPHAPDHSPSIPRRRIAWRLALARSAACLQVKRWTWRQGPGITFFVTQLFPGLAPTTWWPSSALDRR